MHSRRRTFFLAAALAGAVVFGGVAAATGDDTPDVDRAEDATEGADSALTGDNLQLATRAALAHVGEGRVSDTEVGDEESFYEVEVTLDDGRQIDVQLDEDFKVVGLDTEVGIGSECLSSLVGLKCLPRASRPSPPGVARHRAEVFEGARAGRLHTRVVSSNRRGVIS